MHHSRLCSFIVDCKTDDIDRAAAFWSAALGRPVKPVIAGFETYRELETRDDEPMLVLQKVDHDSRIHVDLESDDLEAEVRRLEALGAKRVGFVRK